MTTPRVLVIDDEPQIRKLIRSALEGRGYSVDEAADGRDGARRFRERPPDLVIVDIFMPEKEGIETILELRHVDPQHQVYRHLGRRSFWLPRSLEARRVLRCIAHVLETVPLVGDARRRR